jgi:hypothetical protein
VYLGNSVKDSYQSHVLRLAGGDRILIANNDLRNDPKTNGIRGVLTLHSGNYVYVTGNKISDSPLGLGPLDAGAGSITRIPPEWTVIEKNTFKESQVNVGHGTEHLSVRDNVIMKNDGIAIDMKGYSAEYARGVKDVYIVHNTVINNAKGASSSRSAARSRRSPSATTSTWPRTTRPARPIPRRCRSSAATSRGSARSATTSGRSDDPELRRWRHQLRRHRQQRHVLQDPAEWEAYTQVKNDQYKDVTLSATYKITVGSVIAGADMKMAA